MTEAVKSAIIVGASSGIGEALARQLHKDGWHLGLFARRIERLNAIANDLGGQISVGYADISKSECIYQFRAMIEALGRIDLVIISAGVGHLNQDYDQSLDEETLAVNISGFRAIANAAFRYFEHCGHCGQLAAITSVAGLRGSAEATAYAASKAFQSIYLNGLREAACKKKLCLTITELQPGFVDTAMMKTDTPLPTFIRGLIVSDTATAARQMLRAISRKKKHAYITRRYALIALLLKLLPRPGK
jgi:short-subunit dehydrogenase